ncbi:MAG: hypothetical protein AAGI51_00885 [Pseudomonadota bacterium]
MSDSDSFINEVSEELRRDRMTALWKRYGPWIIGAVALAVAAAAALNWMDSQREAAAQAAGERLAEAASAEDPAARAERFAAAADASEGGPALVARLSEAAALDEAGDETGAIGVLSLIEQDGAADPIYRALAGFKIAMIQSREAGPAQRIDLFAPHAAQGAPFRLLALEQLAAARLLAGDPAGARADAEAARDDPLATPVLQDRLSQLLLLIEAAEDAG